MSKRAMLIDVYYCTGCHSCEVACQQENGYEAKQFGILVTEHILNKKNGLTIDYVPYMTDLCNFCAARVADGGKPSCVKHCQARCITYGTLEEVMEEAKNCKKPMIFVK
ncbi:MAG TPA: oxidoreductase [Clostridiales bacterium]|nr:oxidoreductase [Clostridiales bacterium]